MGKLYFLFGIHNHQPVGNFPEVLEKAFNEAYNPFMDAMCRHPKIKWSLHCTGVLWDYILEKHPEYIEKAKNMVKSGQLEILSGAYYEPIISVIPQKDIKGQVEKLTKFVKSTFNYSARGMWLAERVWEPQLAKSIADSGMKYTLVDDAHFAAAGLKVDRLKGYYVTEEQGSKLNIFPISKLLRYYIPFQTVEKNVEYFSNLSKQFNNPAIIMADDGEKFGLWPETYKHVYQDGWLERFLSALDANSEWIETLTFSEYLEKNKPEGRIYLPTASYFEMSEWALPSETQEEFESIVKQFEHQEHIKNYLKGGFWRNFLTKYEESNNMHKKMLHISKKIENTAKSSKDGFYQKAENSLYASQCNCAYWHGVFGGLYLPHLRNAVYNKLLEAEDNLNKIEAPKKRWEQIDFNCDNQEEVLYENKDQNLYFSPHKGGSLFEWDIIEKKVNLVNVLTRRKEAYHQRLKDFVNNNHGNDGGVKTIHEIVKVKEDNLDNYLKYDWYKRACLIDHFLHSSTKLENFKNCEYGEQGDFVLGHYNSTIKSDKLILERDGTVWINDKPYKINVTKEVVIKENGFGVEYNISNKSQNEANLIFGIEFNLAFCNFLEQDEGIEEKKTEWKRRDDPLNYEVAMKFSKDIDLWKFPIQTVSLSESGFEKTYQGSGILCVNRLVLAGGKNSKLKIEVVSK